MTAFILDSRDYLDTPDRKKFYNEQLFTEVAPKYDAITRLLSFGQDHRWKEALVRALPGTPASCLDIACGTGDLTRMVHARFPNAQIAGLDLTPAMIELAAKHIQSNRVSFRVGDMCDLPYDDASIDLVTGGYALRNAPDIAGAVCEMARVVKPGGHVALLDFNKSPNSRRHTLDYHVLKLWGGFWGWALHGHADVYGYIAESLRRFPDRQMLRQLFAHNNLTPLVEVGHFGGMLLTVICRKTG